VFVYAKVQVVSVVIVLVFVCIGEVEQSAGVEKLTFKV
jgi:hypothetical protein